ncbi:MAG: BREX-3 system phosphatase PglZ [Deltaproteobacteria bacterium]|nr:MAG: BREX-3 system phosphatase PglZ [Deltaproteobacteria bacterium]
MNSWRSQILREFTPQVARLTLVADPDGLLLEEGILQGIRERGFELIPFEDHVAFRYAYESKFRSRWDQGKQTDLVVILHAGIDNLASLPYDLLQAGRKLHFNLGEIFPNLSYPVVTALDRGDFDALYEAQKRYAPGVLGDNATKEFVLRHVFEIAPELVKKSSDLLRMLLRRHYREQRIPTILDKHFIQLVRQHDSFNDWPLETIIPDREAFFTFLQERWPIFIDNYVAKELRGTVLKVREPELHSALSTPHYLPFDHDDIRIYIDNLFLEGLLQAVPAKLPESLSKSWLAIGIRTDKQANRTQRLDGLLDNMASDIPKEDLRYDNWFRFARTWAELVALALESGTVLSEATRQKIMTLQTQIDTAFVAWLKKRYAGLINLPPVPPVMLHHIPRFLARYINDAREHKVAFILVDGLAMDQWIVLRKELAKQRPGYRFHENAVFAWIPTITSVSRQAAFAGKPPIYFPASIHTTNKEQSLWTQFWADQGLTGPAAAYARGLGDGDIDKVREILSHPQIRVAGLVVDKVDKIMHGMELGAAGMLNQVHQWAMQGFMSELIDTLLDQGFQIFLSSDHGNIEAKGCGRPAEGAVADVRGERVRVYPDDLLRAAVKERFPDAIEWPSLGLPEDYRALLAPHRKAFIRNGETIVGHGGISIEELIVPLIQIERREA